MTISPLMIYLIELCHSLCTLLNIALAFFLASLGFTFWLMIGHWDPEDFKKSLTSGFMKRILIAIAVSALGCLFVPSKTTLIQMLVIPPIVNNEQIQELPANVLNFINDYLKEVGKKEKDL